MKEGREMKEERGRVGKVRGKEDERKLLERKKSREKKD